MTLVATTPAAVPTPSRVERSALDAAATPAVWVGLVGSSAIAIGELRRRGIGLGAWVDQTVSGRAVAVWWIFTGILLLSLAWVLARPRDGRAALPLGLVAAVWVVPLLFLPPLLSTDAGSYADLGWMVSHGFDPYTQGLGTTGSPFAYGRAWRGTTSVYPAGSLLLFGWVVAATGAQAFWSVVALRGLALAGLVLLVVAVPRLARTVGADPHRAVWLDALNPIVIVHGVGGEHVDLLMVGFLVAGLALARTRAGLVLGAVVIGLAALVKQPALLAAPVVGALWLIGRRPTWPRTLVHAAGTSAIALATFVAISQTTLGLGWLDGTGSPTKSATPTLAYLIAQAAGNPAGLQSILERVAAFIAVAAVGYLAVRHLRNRPLRFLALASVAWVAGFGAVREWYLVLPLALLGLAVGSRWLVGIVPVTVLFAVIGVFVEYQRWSAGDAFYTSLGWAVVFSLTAWGIDRLRVRSLLLPVGGQRPRAVGRPAPSDR